MVAGNGQVFHLARKAGDQGRPRSSRKASISSRREDANMWAKSVSKDSTENSTALVEPLLVNEEIASAMLSVSERKVWQLADDGALRVKRIGRRKLYLVDSLKAFAESSKEVE